MLSPALRNTGRTPSLPLRLRWNDRRIDLFSSRSMRLDFGHPSLLANYAYAWEIEVETPFNWMLIGCSSIPRNWFSQVCRQADALKQHVMKYSNKRCISFTIADGRMQRIRCWNLRIFIGLSSSKPVCLIVKMHRRLSHLTSDPIPSTCELRPTSTTRSTLRQQRRRLDDSIRSYASNDYSTFPPSMSEQSNYSARHCDLFNLLEQPSTVKHSPSQVGGTKSPLTERSASLRRYHRLNDRQANDPDNRHSNSSRKGLFRRVARNYFCMTMTASKADLSS